MRPAVRYVWNHAPPDAVLLPLASLARAGGPCDGGVEVGELAGHDLGFVAQVIVLGRDEEDALREFLSGRAHGRQQRIGQISSRCDVGPVEERAEVFEHVLLGLSTTVRCGGFGAKRALVGACEVDDGVKGDDGADLISDIGELGYREGEVPARREAGYVDAAGGVDGECRVGDDGGHDRSDVVHRRGEVDGRGFVVVDAHDDEGVRVGEGAVDFVVERWVAEREAASVDRDEEGVFTVGRGCGVAVAATAAPRDEYSVLEIGADVVVLCIGRVERAEFTAVCEAHEFEEQRGHAFHEPYLDPESETGEERSSSRCAVSGWWCAVGVGGEDGVWGCVCHGGHGDRLHLGKMLCL